MAGQAQDPLIGQVVSARYRVVRPLGEGGMGQVYLAIHEAIEKQVALKVLKPEYSAKEEIITRFQQEAISASRIKHPNVLEVFDFGTLNNGCAFLAMEFLQGNDVADELVRMGYLDTTRAIRIMLQVCRALAAAHRAGVVHRDMKPDNIFLVRTADGEEIVKIVDFGIAQLRNPEEEAKSEAKPRRRLTKTGMIFGTPEYMAPEQAAGRKADSRVDVYACGIIMFEMLTGAVPFTGDSFMAVLAAHLNDPAPSMMEFRPDLSVSQELHDVVRRMLEKKPENRYQSMGEVAKALIGTPEGSHVQRDAPMSVVQAISSIPPPAPGHATAAQFNPYAGHPTPPGQAAPGQPAQAKVRTSPTLEAATTSGAASGKKGGMGVALGVVGFLLVAGGAAAFFVVPKLLNGDKPVPTDTPVVANPVETTALPVGSLPVNPPPVATVASTAELSPTTASTALVNIADSAKVKIRVETTPPGAKVTKDDGYQVCDATPCEIEVDRGEAVQLVAALGNKKGSSKVEAQKDQTVSIVLKAPKGGSSGGGEERMCEVPGPGGLKIFRKCQ